MDEIRKYLGRPISLEAIKDKVALKALGFSCRYLPDPPEDFDEFEFLADLGGLANLGLMVTVESMAIKRVFFGIVSLDDPDVVTGLEESQVKKIFEESGDRLFQFFDAITQ